ncbi:ribose-phosphate pyrophosphokinase [Sphingomonas sp. CJ99]
MAGGRPDGTLAEWMAAEGFAPESAASVLADVPRIRAILIAAAREGRAVSYSEALGALGLRFTRPKMRALCRTLDAIDRDELAAGRPALAALVVRESDGLPGQGWWTGSDARGYAGAWTGPEAATHVRALQEHAFDYWAG